MTSRRIIQAVTFRSTYPEDYGRMYTALLHTHLGPSRWSPNDDGALVMRFPTETAVSTLVRALLQADIGFSVEVSR